MAETPSGMLNSIGLQGPGIESFIANDLEWLRSHGGRTVVSIAGGRVEEFVALVALLTELASLVYPRLPAAAFAPDAAAALPAALAAGTN